MIDIKNTLIAATLCLAIGFSAGYYTKAQFVKADQIDAATESRHQTATNIETSLETSLAVEKDVAASTKKISEIRKETSAHLKEKRNDTKPQARCDAADAVLDWNTVFLLNAARASVTDGSSSGSDGKGETLTEIGVTQFIDNDLEVVDLYHELATRHDALVDWVEAEVKKRNQ